MVEYTQVLLPELLLKCYNPVIDACPIPERG